MFPENVRLTKSGILKIKGVAEDRQITFELWRKNVEKPILEFDIITAFQQKKIGSSRRAERVVQKFFSRKLADYLLFVFLLLREVDKLEPTN